MWVHGSGKAGKQTVGIATRAKSKMISPTTCRKQKTDCKWDKASNSHATSNKALILGSKPSLKQHNQWGGQCGIIHIQTTAIYYLTMLSIPHGLQLWRCPLLLPASLSLPAELLLITLFLSSALEMNSGLPSNSTLPQLSLLSGK